MRVLFVSQYFPPETGAAPSRAEQFVRALERAGHQVDVITGLPNHPSGVIRPNYGPGTDSSGTTTARSVQRVWLYASPKKTALRRLTNHVTFALWALPAAIRTQRPDVVVATIPPPFLGVTAWLAAARFRRPLVIDMRDDWPYAAIALGEMRPGIVADLLERLVRFVTDRAAHVIVVTPGMARRIHGRGVPIEKMTLITNGADTGMYGDRSVESRVTTEPVGGPAMMTVLYAGTHGLIHGMDVLIDAAERLRARDDIRFLLVGDGVAKSGLQARVRADGLQNVEFRPSVAPERLAAIVRGADVCVATTRNEPFCGETIPVKLFDYLAAGRPVVAAVLGDAAAVVTASRAGIVVEPGDGETLARVLIQLADDPVARQLLGEPGPAFVEKHYSRSVLGARFVEVVEAAADGQRGSSLVRGIGWYGLGKRAIDLTGSILALLVLWPVLLLIGGAVVADSPGPALFQQRRIGRRGSEFVIYKFRTMPIGTPDLASHLLGPEDRKVTRVGSFLRRTSLDELPQLLNVVRGDMSLVGPRPALFNQDDLVSMRRAAGVDVLRPGITGLAQIEGRDELGLQEKVAFDARYLREYSFRTDISIIGRTVLALVSGRGAN